MRGDLVERSETLCCDIEDREFKSRLWSTRGWKTINQAVNENLFQKRKDKTVKGDGRHWPFKCGAQIQWTFNSTFLTTGRLWETFTLQLILIFEDM